MDDMDKQWTNYGQIMGKLLVHILSIVCPLFVHAEEPWGQDAEMAYPCMTAACPSQPSNSPFLAVSRFLIRFHQEVISPCDGPRSHYRPSSSQYMLDAIQKYGFLQGVPMGCDRLMRENSEEWVYRMTVDEQGNPIKWDPVK